MPIYRWARRLFRTFSIPVPQKDASAAIQLRNHDVAFHDVYFGYGNYDVVHGVSFTAKEGSVTALVGPSGSGKSTIASLVPRFWDCRDGRVTIGGDVNVTSIGIEHLMDTVAFVFQNTFLFSDTIAANIRFGNPDASDQEMIAAAKAARAHDFIMLCQMVMTPIWESRQRLCLAASVSALP